MAQAKRAIKSGASSPPTDHAATGPDSASASPAYSGTTTSLRRRGRCITTNATIQRPVHTVPTMRVGSMSEGLTVPMAAISSTHKRFE